MANCAIVGCSANKTKCRGLSFHAVKRTKDPDWENALVRAVNRQDSSFNPKRAVICSRHFTPDCFTTQEHSGFRVLKEKSVPTLHLPQRSFQRLPRPRKSPAKRKFATATVTSEAQDPDDDNWLDITQDATSENTMSYEDILDRLQMPEGWMISRNNGYSDIYFYADFKVKYAIRLHADLVMEGRLAGIPLQQQMTSAKCPEDITNLISRLENSTPCGGLSAPIFHNFTGQTFHQDVSYNFCTKKTMKLVRSNDCSAFGPLCPECTALRKLLLRRIRRRENQDPNIKKHTPLSIAGNARLKRAVIFQRKENAKLRRKLEKKISKEGVTLDQKISDGLCNIMTKNTDKMTPYMKKFWMQQKENLTRSAKGHRWHPAIIRTALMLHSQSPQAYRSLRQTGLLTLPCESTLRDYTNAVCPTQGFQPEIIAEIATKSRSLEENEKWVVLMFDEMKIQENLVYNPRNGELVGFVNEGHAIANHVLVFMVCGLVKKDLKFTLGHFGTVAVAAGDLYHLLWSAVYLLEKRCGLKNFLFTGPVICSYSSVGSYFRQGGG